METSIHPSAIVSDQVRIGEACSIGPFAIIEAGCVIGDGNHIGPGVHITGNVRIGSGNRFSNQCCIGHDPQHSQFDPSRPTGVVVGDGNTFHEFCTVHRSTEHENTVIGNGGRFMVNSHIAHDCVVGDGVVMTNNAVLAGFVEIESRAVLSAYVAIHQFCRVGRGAMVGAYSKIVQDVPPFALVDGNPARLYDANVVGLRRAGFGSAERSAIRGALKRLRARSGGLAATLRTLRQRYPDSEPVEAIARFVEASRRGIV